MKMRVLIFALAAITLASCQDDSVSALLRDSTWHQSLEDVCDARMGGIMIFDKDGVRLSTRGDPDMPFATIEIKDLPRPAKAEGDWVGLRFPYRDLADKAGPETPTILGAEILDHRRNDGKLVKTMIGRTVMQHGEVVPQAKADRLLRLFTRSQCEAKQIP